MGCIASSIQMNNCKNVGIDQNERFRKSNELVRYLMDRLKPNDLSDRMVMIAICFSSIFKGYVSIVYNWHAPICSVFAPSIKYHQLDFGNQTHWRCTRTFKLRAFCKSNRRLTPRAYQTVRLFNLGMLGIMCELFKYIQTAPKRRHHAIFVNHNM